MAKFIYVTAVLGGPEGSRVEEDDLGNVTVHPAAEVTVPMAINIEAIRSFSKRKGDRVGTRFTFQDRSAFPVADTIEEVTAKIAAVQEG